jgi:hypothetical protein
MGRSLQVQGPFKFSLLEDLPLPCRRLPDHPPAGAAMTALEKITPCRTTHTAAISTKECSDSTTSNGQTVQPMDHASSQHRTPPHATYLMGDYM